MTYQQGWQLALVQVVVRCHQHSARPEQLELVVLRERLIIVEHQEQQELGKP